MSRRDFWMQLYATYVLNFMKLGFYDVLLRKLERKTMHCFQVYAAERYMVHSDICLFLTLYLLKDWHRTVTKLPTSVAQFFKIVEEHACRQNAPYLIFDQLAAACVIDAAVICEAKHVCASVDLYSSEAPGQMVVDLNKAQGKTDNVCVVTRINQALFEKLITAAFSLL